MCRVCVIVSSLLFVQVWFLVRVRFLSFVVCCSLSLLFVVFCGVCCVMRLRVVIFVSCVVCCHVGVWCLLYVDC